MVSLVSTSSLILANSASSSGRCVLQRPANVNRDEYLDVTAEQSLGESAVAETPQQSTQGSEDGDRFSEYEEESQPDGEREEDNEMDEAVDDDPDAMDLEIRIKSKSKAKAKSKPHSSTRPKQKATTAQQPHLRRPPKFMKSTRPQKQARDRKPKLVFKEIDRQAGDQDQLLWSDDEDSGPHIPLSELSGLNVSSKRAIRSTAKAVSESPVSSCQRFREVHRTGGLLGLVWEIYKVAKQGKKLPALEQTSLKQFKQVALPVLANIPKPILRELIDHNLFHAYLGEKKPDVREAVDRYNAVITQGKVAVCYLISLTDENGLGSTKREKGGALAYMKQYANWEYPTASELNHAKLIDKWGHPRHQDVKDDLKMRRYLPPYYDPTRATRISKDDLLEIKYAGCEPPKEKVARWHGYIKINHAFWKSFAHDGPIANSYAGYTYNVAEWWKAHSKDPHNPFMGGERAALNMQEKRVFRFRKIVVVPIVDAPESSIAEIIVEVLGGTDYKDGQGYNIAGAGESNDSVFNMTMHEQINSCAANLQAEINRIEGLSQCIEKQVEGFRNDVRNGIERQEMVESIIEDAEDECEQLQLDLTMALGLQKVDELLELKFANMLLEDDLDRLKQKNEQRRHCRLKKRHFDDSPRR